MADSTTTDTPDLVASTGVNDPNSPWGNGLLQTALTDATQIGASALSQALHAQTPVSSTTGGAGLPINPASSAPLSASARAQNWTPWIIGGVALLVLGWLLFRE